MHKPFSTAYLPGFLADKYDVSQQASMERIEGRARNSIKSEMRNTVRGYSMVTTEMENFDFENKGVKYALMPVWMLSTKWKGQNFLFAMNGQTGKLIGDIPVDKGKFWGLFAAIAAPLAIISREQPAANFLSLNFFLRLLSSISETLFDGRMSAAAPIRPVSSSQAKSTFSISCSGFISTVIP